MMLLWSNELLSYFLWLSLTSFGWELKNHLAVLKVKFNLASNNHDENLLVT